MAIAFFILLGLLILCADLWLPWVIEQVVHAIRYRIIDPALNPPNQTRDGPGRRRFSWALRMSLLALFVICVGTWIYFKSAPRPPPGTIFDAIVDETVKTVREKGPGSESEREAAANELRDAANRIKGRSPKP